MSDKSRCLEGHARDTSARNTENGEVENNSPGSTVTTIPGAKGLMVPPS
eukprot:COSAG02_NODE_26394_length_634_cov_0.859813_1_plen_48_part_10